MAPGVGGEQDRRGDAQLIRSMHPTSNAMGTSGGTILLLSVHSKQPYGLQVGVVGDAAVFGAWEPEVGLRLKWTEGNIWTARVELPAGTASLEYKLVTMHKMGFNDWEQYDNRLLRLDDNSPVVTLSGNFEGPLRVNASLPETETTTNAEIAQTLESLQESFNTTMPPPPPPPPDISNLKSNSVPPPPNSFKKERPSEIGNTTFDTPVDGKFIRAPDFFRGSGSTDPENGEIMDSVSSNGSASASTTPPPPDPDPYAAFEQRVSATFAKLQSAAERTNTRFTSDTKRWGKSDERSSAGDCGDGTDGGGSGFMPSTPGTDGGYDWNVNGGSDSGFTQSNSRTAQTTQQPASASASFTPAYDVSSERNGFTTRVETVETERVPSTSTEWYPSSNAVPQGYESSVEVKYDMASDASLSVPEIPQISVPPPPVPVSQDKLNRLPSDAARTLVNSDEGKRKSWIQKLGLAAVMVGSVEHGTIDETTLAILGVYLRWVGTCVIESGLDDGSRSIGAAALLSRDVFVALESDNKSKTPAGIALARKVHPWLPSIQKEFSGDKVASLLESAARVSSSTTSTTISPSFLKRFRETVEVPLTRNAGPSALFASEHLLQQMRLDGDTSDSEMERFTEALARYFNRAPALDRLDSMRQKGAFEGNREASAAVAELADAMEALDAYDVTIARNGQNDAETAATLRAIQALATVRSHFVAAISQTSLSPNAPREDVSKRQAYRMAELSLEETARTMLGRVETLVGLDDSGTDTFFNALNGGRNDNVWTVGCAVVSSALRHISHSGWRIDACNAVANDLDVCVELTGGIPLTSSEDALRLTAALHRASRLAAAHDAALVKGYGDLPSVFADALRVETPDPGTKFIAEVVNEGIPSRVVRLVEPMLRCCLVKVEAFSSGNSFQGQESSDDACVNSGTAVGIMVEVDYIQPGALTTANTTNSPVIAFVTNASGSEDVAAGGRDLRGIVCASPVRGTSRLAIRAAQDGVPITAASTLSGAMNVRSAANALAGEWVFLGVSPKSRGGVELRRATSSEIDVAKLEHDGRIAEVEVKKRQLAVPGESPALLAGPFRSITPKLTQRPCVRDLSDATANRAGYKAASLGDLQRVASRSASGFKALPGVVLPFGCFEACVAEQGNGGRLKIVLSEIDEAVGSGDAESLELACLEAQQIAKQTLVSPEIAATVCAAFIGDDPLGVDTVNNRNEGRSNTSKVPLLSIRASFDVEDPACCGKNEQTDASSGFIFSAAKSRDVAEAVSAAWAGQFTPFNVIRRAVTGKSMPDATCAVVVQPLAPGAVSFEARSGDGNDTTRVSLGPGFGGWARGVRDGDPYVVDVRQSDGDAVSISHCSIDVARRVVGSQVITQPVEYMDSQSEYASLCLGPEAEKFRGKLARRITAITVALGAEFGSPQVVEGCLVGDVLFVTRTRPQQP